MVTTMARLASCALLLWTAVSVAGCSGDYEIAARYNRGAKGSPAKQAPAPMAGSPSPSVPEPSPPGGPSGEAPGVGPTGQPVVGQPVRPSVAGPPKSSSPGAVKPSAVQPTPVPPIPSQPTPPQQPSIRLSAGVALPQSLPTGTAMGFSVDYVFTSGQPGLSLPYVWVVEPAKGQPVKLAVELKDRGTLQGFIPQFRPEHGPFKTHVEDAEGNRLSPSVPLR